MEPNREISKLEDRGLSSEVPRPPRGRAWVKALCSTPRCSTLGYIYDFKRCDRCEAYFCLDCIDGHGC